MSNSVELSDNCTFEPINFTSQVDDDLLKNNNTILFSSPGKIKAALLGNNECMAITAKGVRCKNNKNIHSNLCYRHYNMHKNNMKIIYYNEFNNLPYKNENESTKIIEYIRYVIII